LCDHDIEPNFSIVAGKVILVHSCDVIVIYFVKKKKKQMFLLAMVLYSATGTAQN
jgi:hypothetical protein